MSYWGFIRAIPGSYLIGNGESSDDSPTRSLSSDPPAVDSAIFQTFLLPKEDVHY